MMLNRIQLLLVHLDLFFANNANIFNLLQNCLSVHYHVFKSESMEPGSASGVGVEEDSQIDSQLINSPTLSDNGDSEPIDNTRPVIRRPLQAVAKRPPFLSTTS
jgi:hypothetical protein